MWEFWEFLKGVRVNRVEDSIAMMESIMVGVGGSNQIAEAWQKVLEEAAPTPKEKPKARTKASKAAAVKRLAGLFKEFG